jgi:hypothetical protein
MFDLSATVRLSTARTTTLDTCLDRLAELQRQMSVLGAEQVDVLARIGALTGGPNGIGADLVSCVLNVPLRSAQKQIAIAETLHRNLPATRAALADGALPVTHAQLIAEAAWDLSVATQAPGEGPSAETDDGTRSDAGHARGGPALPPVAQQLETAALERAKEQTTTQLRGALRRAVIKIDPRRAHERHAQAREDRTVWLQDSDHGMATLTALLPAPQALTIYRRLTRAAKDRPQHDPRTRDQRRADLYTHLLLTALDETGAADGRVSHRLADEPIPADGTPRGRRSRAADEQRGSLRPSIQVIVAASTLLCQDDNPAWLAGYGPITAEHARELAHDRTGTWKRLLVDPIGQPLAYGTNRYRPPPALIRHITVRDATCVFPTCQQPAHRVDLDHIVPFAGALGGPTEPANLAPLCRRHHNYKTLRQARYHRNSDGTYTWTIGGTRDAACDRTSNSPPGGSRTPRVGRRFTTYPPIRWQAPGAVGTPRASRRGAHRTSSDAFPNCRRSDGAERFGFCRAG